MTSGGWDDDPDEEVLAGPRLPRWTMPALGAAAVLAVVGVVVAQLVQGDPTQRAAPSPTSTAPAPTTASRSAVPPFDYLNTLGPGLTPVDLTALGPVVDVHTDGTNVWELQPGTLIRQTSQDFSAATIQGISPGRLRAGGRLVPDAAAGLLWVVVLGIDGTEVQAYRAQTLDVVATLRWPRSIAAAAALDGALYLADSDGVSVVHPSVPPKAAGVHLADLPATEVLAMVGDPMTGTVLLLAERPGGTQLLTLDGDTLTATRGPDIDSAAALVVTTAGQVWAGGQGPAGPVLTRLDAAGNGYAMPIGLLAPLYGDGGTVLAAGAVDLLVGGAGGVVCLRGTDGAPLQRWRAAAVRASIGPRFAYATTGDGGLVQLPFDGCTG